MYIIKFFGGNWYNNIKVSDTKQCLIDWAKENIDGVLEFTEQEEIVFIKCKNRLIGEIRFVEKV